MRTERTIELAESFDVIDSAGRTHRLNVWQTVMRTPMLDGSVDITKGLKDAKLSDGTELNHVDDDTFRAVFTGETYKRA